MNMEINDQLLGSVEKNSLALRELYFAYGHCKS